MTEREFQIHVARVHLAECARRRRHWPSRDFYWSLFAWAQNARRRAASRIEANQSDGNWSASPVQTGLSFGAAA